jgi:hypothetical protein
MPAEYQLDWSKAKPNPYAARLRTRWLWYSPRTWLKRSRRRNPWTRSSVASLLPCRDRVAGPRHGAEPILERAG